MHARVVTLQVRSHKTDGLVAIFRDVMVPSLREQPGFCGAQLLTDGNLGKGVMVTFWEQEAHMRSTEASGWFRDQLTRLQPVLSAPVVAERYDVTVHV